MSVTLAVRRTLIVVLAMNALVTIIKLVVGVRTGTLTVVGAALESGLDLLNNVIALTLVGIAHRAPDEDHPYGHEKFETLGTLAVVGFLSISCFELLREENISGSAEDLARVKLAPEFEHYTREDLLVLHSFLIARLRGRSDSGPDNRHPSGAAKARKR